MVNRQMKRRSTSLSIREMYIKTRYYLTSVRIASSRRQEGPVRLWWKKKSLFTVGGNVNWSNHYGEYGGFLRN